MELKYTWACYMETTPNPQNIAVNEKSIKTHLLEIII